MATFYVGVRPILRGRNIRSEYVNVHKSSAKQVGTYSHYPLFGKGLLDGGPDNNHTPGSGRSPHGLKLTRTFNGSGDQTKANSLSDSGQGARMTGFRWKPLEYKGTVSIFNSGYGHADRRGIYYQLYSNESFDGVTSAQVMTNVGHAKRAIGATGTANTFGAFDPFVRKGVGSSALNDPAHTGVTYAHNTINEWKGVASAKAL